MAHVKIDHSTTPIRLFNSNFLEFFTHISPVAVLAIWLPIIGFFLYMAIKSLPRGGSWLHIPLGFLAGLAVWTLAEYLLHRFVFHFRACSPLQERVTFLFHGIHHLQPNDKTRLVMPPVVSIPLAVIFYGLFYLVIGLLLNAPQWVNPLVAGFALGYLAYDMIHYATHHFPMRWSFLKILKRHHMAHHYKSPDMRFGVSSTVWDHVFRTYPSA